MSASTACGYIIYLLQQAHSGHAPLSYGRSSTLSKVLGVDTSPFGSCEIDRINPTGLCNNVFPEPAIRSASINVLLTIIRLLVRQA